MASNIDKLRTEPCCAVPSHRSRELCVWAVLIDVSDAGGGSSLEAALHSSGTSSALRGEEVVPATSTPCKLDVGDGSDSPAR